MIATSCSILAPSILQKVYTIRFIRTLGQELQHNSLPIRVESKRVEDKLRRSFFLSYCPSNVNHRELTNTYYLNRVWMWMMKLASLAELARPVLQKILTHRLIRAYWKHWHIGIRRLYTSSTLNVCGMIVLAGGTIFTTPRSQVVTAIFQTGHSWNLVALQ